MVHSTVSGAMSASHPCTLLILFIALGTFLQLLLVGLAILYARERQRRRVIKLSESDDEARNGLLSDDERRSLGKEGGISLKG